MIFVSIKIESNASRWSNLSTWRRKKKPRHIFIWLLITWISKRWRKFFGSFFVIIFHRKTCVEKIKQKIKIHIQIKNRSTAQLCNFLININGKRKCEGRMHWRGIFGDCFYYKMTDPKNDTFYKKRKKEMEREWEKKTTTTNKNERVFYYKFQLHPYFIGIFSVMWCSDQNIQHIIPVAAGSNHTHIHRSHCVKPIINKNSAQT